MELKKFFKILEIADILEENAKKSLTSNLREIFEEFFPILNEVEKTAVQVKYYNINSFEEKMEENNIELTYSKWNNDSDGTELLDICVNDLDEQEKEIIADIIKEKKEVLEKLDYIYIFQ